MGILDRLRDHTGVPARAERAQAFDRAGHDGPHLGEVGGPGAASVG